MTCTCNHNHLTINGVLRQDPTRTQMLRKAFEGQMKKRFNIIKQAIILNVAKKDIFALDKKKPITILEEFIDRQFQFTRSDQKINSFMEWLNEMEKKHILTVTERPGIHTGSEPWTNIYVQSAYQKGISSARQKLRKAGYDVPRGEGPLGRDSIGVAFNQLIHAEAAAMAFTRTFSELRGITSVMDQQISRVLAESLAGGKGAYQTARDMVDRVDNIGINRARMVARTEIVRAHHVATIKEYEQWGVEGVDVVAEWLTAGFGVCPECMGLAKKSPYTLREIFDLIPVHPNCRCTSIPRVKKLDFYQ
jgi:hypothetical protein